MAGSRTFNSISKDHAGTHTLPGNLASAPHMPYSMAGWINPATVLHDSAIWGLADDGAPNDHQYIKLNTGSGFATGAQAINRDGSQTVQNPDGSRVWSVGAWMHLGLGFTSAGAMVSYFDGVGASGGVSRTPDAMDSMTIGCNPKQAGQQWCTGLISWVALWNVQLTGAEFLALARGENPQRIRPNELLCVWPLWENTDTDDVRDIWGGFDLETYSGSLFGGAGADLAPVDSGPPIEIWWPGKGRGFFEVVAGGTSQNPTASLLPLAAPAVTLDLPRAQNPTATQVPLAAPAVTVDLPTEQNPTATQVPLAAPAVTVDLPTDQNPTPSVVPLAAPAVTVELGTSQNPTPSVLPLAAPAVTVDLPRAQNPTPSVVPLAAPAVTVDLGSVQNPTPSVLPLAAPAVTVDLPTDQNPTPSVLPLGAPAVTLDLPTDQNPTPLQVPLFAPVVTIDLATEQNPSATQVPLAAPAVTLDLPLGLNPSPSVLPLFAPPVLRFSGAPTVILTLDLEVVSVLTLDLEAPGMVTSDLEVVSELTLDLEA